MNMARQQVIKRDNRVVAYKREKIKNAIYKAMLESGQNAGEDDAEKVAIAVEERLKKEFYKEEKIPTVEEIQDIVEECLMSAGFMLAAKSYILYRSKRQKVRLERKNKGPESSLLSDEFLSFYKHRPNPFPTQLGEFVYYRTYSRWLPEEQRREYWWETVKRAVEYNCSLAPTSREEAEKLYDNVYHLKNFMAGRTLWTASTESSRRYGMSNFNCSFIIIDSFKAFQDIFYLLMIGSGVGFRVLPEDVAKLPRIRQDVEIIHKYYEPVEKEARREYTDFDFEDDVVTLNIGDSKEGWVQALEYYFKFLVEHSYRPIKRIIFNYDSVRPKGEKLKTFGGTASGHQSLKRMFTKIDKLLKEKAEKEWDEYRRIKLKPIDAMDIANIIAENVVSGGVRRSSQICLFSADDHEIAQAKNNLYILRDGEWVINPEISHRQMSNNSIFYREKPSREQLHWHIKQLRYSGEPGFINAVEAGRRRENFNGVNPCAEVLLDSRGVCNLTSVNVMAFVSEDGKLDKEALFEAQHLSVRAGYRMSLIEFELPDWDLVNKRDRLIGASLTGWQDMKNAVGLDKAEEAELLRELRKMAWDAAREIALQLGGEEPALVTTIKPEGTQAQMPTVSSGLHYSHSPYYIRRVRISAADPLARVCEELNYPIFPEVGQDPVDPETLVIEFPVKAPDGRTKRDVSAIEQLETYKLFMENYVDHNASITVHVRDNEWDDVENWLWENWDSVVGISFISYDDSFYDLMPYEEIDKEEYEKRVKSMARFNPSLVSKYESEYKEREIDESSCDNGACPVR